MDPEYGHAYGNEPPSERGKFESGGYQPPQQYPVYHGHQQTEHVPHPKPPFPYPAPSGSSLPSAVYTTDHAHITRGDANPRYHKIKDFFKGRRHKHRDDHQEQEALPQLPDLSVALNDTQSLGRYPRIPVSTEPDATPMMAGEMSSMKSHPHRRSINPTKKQHSPLSQGSPTTSSSSDEPTTPNRHSAFIEETNSKGSTHIQFIPHASGYDQQHIPQYNHRQHQSEPDYLQPQPEYGYQQHSGLQQWGYGQYRPSDGATPTGRRSSIDGGITPSQRTYQSHFSHAPSHHTDRSSKSRKRSTSFSAAPPPADARSTNTIQPHTYVPAPNGAVAYAPSANTHRSGHSQQTALINAPIPRDFASYNPSTSISPTSTHEGYSGRDSGRRSKMGMTRRRSNSHPPAINASSQHSSRDPSHHSSQQAPSVHSSHRSTRQPDYGATRPVKEDDMKTDSDILKSLHGTDFEEMMIAKGVLKVPSSGDDGYDYARLEKSTRGRRQSDAEKSHHGRVGLRERMGMTRKRSSSHPPSIINTYPQAQATTNPSSPRTPYFNAFSSSAAPPPAPASHIYQPSHNPSASASSHRTHSGHTSSPNDDYAKSTTTRGSIASTLKREHMGLTRRRSNSHPTPTTFSPSQLYNTPSSNPIGYTTSESKAYPPSAMAHNGSHRRRASVGMKPRFEIPTSKPMERGTIDWGDDLEESERRRGRGRDGAPEDRSKHARPPLTPPPHPKPFELREYKYGLREPVYQPI